MSLDFIIQKGLRLPNSFLITESNIIFICRREKGSKMMHKFAVRSPPRAHEPIKSEESSEDESVEESEHINSSDEEVSFQSRLILMEHHNSDNSNR